MPATVVAAIPDSGQIHCGREVMWVAGEEVRMSRARRRAVCALMLAAGIVLVSAAVSVRAWRLWQFLDSDDGGSLLVADPTWRERSSLVSTDGSYVATLVEVFGGATMGDYLLVSVRHSSERLFRRADGSLKETDAVTSGIVFSVRGRPQVRLRWKSARQLVIAVPAEATREREERGSWRDVTVTYETLRQ